MSTVIHAHDLTRQHLCQPIRVKSAKTYDGILRHFTHTETSVHVFITSSDNAVIVASLRLDPDHEIQLTGATE